MTSWKQFIYFNKYCFGQAELFAANVEIVSVVGWANEPKYIFVRIKSHQSTRFSFFDFFFFGFHFLGQCCFALQLSVIYIAGQKFISVKVNNGQHRPEFYSFFYFLTWSRISIWIYTFFSFWFRTFRSAFHISHIIHCQVRDANTLNKFDSDVPTSCPHNGLFLFNFFFFSFRFVFICLILHIDVLSIYEISYYISTGVRTVPYRTYNRLPIQLPKSHHIIHFTLSKKKEYKNEKIQLNRNKWPCNLFQFRK